MESSQSAGQGAAQSSQPCSGADDGCRQLSPTPAERFLQQALGANQFDMRFVSALFTGVLLISVAAAWWRRRRRSAEVVEPESVGVDDTDGQ